MPVEVIMPKVDMDMASGKIMSWRVGEGETVTKGEALFDIETDKAAMEIDAPESGVLHFLAPEGSDIPIGEAVAWIYLPDEAVGEQPRPFATHDSSKLAHDEQDPITSAAVENETAAPATVTHSSNLSRATPSARRMVREAGLHINAISGSGPLGRVQAKDVRNALESKSTLAAPPSFDHECGPLVITRSKGGTGTPVVLVHGFASDAQSWATIEPYIKHRPLIRIDLPCHGKSPKRRIASFAALVQDTRDAFDALHLEQAHLIGHSLGGALSLALADTRPRSIASLTLIAPAGLGPEINGASLSGISAATRAESLGPWLKTLVADETLVTESYIRFAMAGRSDPALRAAQAALANELFPDGVQAFDLRAALDRVEIPTRLIWGKRDAIIPWQQALRAPGRTALHLLEGVGHIPQIEQPELVGQILRAIV